MRTPDPPDYEAFFRDYAKAYERSLGERVDTEAIRRCFAESFISAHAGGQVAVGANDASFERSLKDAYAFYKSIGTIGMKVDRVATDAIDDSHDRVRVFYVAEYRKRDGTTVSVPFDVVYLVQRRRDGPKIFGFIAGDEMAVYRAHGLVDDAGRPA